MKEEKIIALTLVSIFCLLLFLWKSKSEEVISSSSSSSSSSTTTFPPTTTTTSPPSPPPPPEESFPTRAHLGPYLESHKFETGAELGVQNGLFSFEILKKWPSCKKFYLIDIWKPQENYFDGANVPQHLQDQAYQNTIRRLSPFKNKIQILRMLTSEAVHLIPDNSLDFIYIDARHDYCGVMEDLVKYWPKLRKNVSGSVIAGHDYKTAAEVRLINKGEDWGVCANGTRHEGSVKGAVDDFFKKKKLQITNELWASWIFRYI
jgi:hypothetical protein